MITKKTHFTFSKKQRLVHIILVTIILLFYWQSDGSVDTLLWGGILSFITLFYLSISEMKKSRTVINPLSFALGWYGIVLGISAIYQYFLLLDSEMLTLGVTIIRSNYVVQGYVIFSVGFLFLHIGLRILEPKVKSLSYLSKSHINTLLILSFLYIYFNSYLGFLGNLLIPLNFGLIAGLTIFAINDPKKFRLSTQYHFTLLMIGTILLFLFSISSASKGTMAFAFLPLIWYLIIKPEKRRYLMLALLIISVVYFYLIYPLSYDLRAQHWAGREPSIEVAFENSLKEDYFKYDNKYDHNPLAGFLQRTYQPSIVAYFGQIVDSHGYQYGSTFKYLIYAFIPRIFWSGKPTVSQSAWFTYYIGMARSPETATSATGMTAVGELYWNFGIVGVIMGMFIVGLGFSYLWRICGNDPRYNILSALLFIIIISNLQEMAEFGSTIVGIVLMIIIFKVAYRIQKRSIVNL